MAKKAVHCGKMFDSTDGSVKEQMVIVLEGDKIVQVLPEAAFTAEADTEEIDLSGSFVTPGLIDCHMHLAANGEGSSLGTMPYTTIGTGVLKALNNVQKDLMAGFTSIRSCGDEGYLDVALRNAIDRGEFTGPRLMVPGVAITSTGGHADTHYSPYLEECDEVRPLAADGPSGMRKAVRTNLKHGADFIKFMSTGGVMSLGTTVGAQQMSLEEMKTICDTAKMYGVITATHAHGTSGIKDAIRAGVTSIEHGMLMDEEGISLMKEHGTTLVPTLIAAERIITMGAQIGSPDWMIAKAKQVFGCATHNFKRCIEEGVPIAFGTDTGTPYNFHGKQTYEFELMVQYGMTPAQALVSATRTGAQLMRRWDSVGSLEAGKFADIVAFDGDPIQDISVMNRCTFVMKGGEVVKG